MESYSLILAKYLVKEDIGDIHFNAINKAKKCILDYLGVALNGSKNIQARPLYKYLKSVEVTQESTVIGYPDKISVELAGFANAYAGHVIQMDDGDSQACAHLGTCIIPAALAVAEKYKCSGKKFLEAVIVGYEVAIRIGRAINPSHNSRGFSPNGTVGIFGAVSATSKLLSLTTEEIVNAFGLAAMQASGVEQFIREGTMDGFLNAAHATEMGIRACFLSKQGMTGAKKIFEGDRGYCKAFSDNFNLDTIIADLGIKYLIEDVYFKLYPICGWSMAAVDATLKLKEKYNITPDQILNIDITMCTLAEKITNNLKPPNFSAAMLSTQYVVGLAILDGRVDIDQFTDDKMNDKELNKIIQKVKINIDNKKIFSLHPRGRSAIVKIKTQNNEFKSEVKVAKGESEYPLSQKEIEGKFIKLTKTILSPKKQFMTIKLVDSLQHLEKLYRITNIFRI